jgi:hypothetical protein
VYRYVEPGDGIIILFGYNVPAILRNWNWEQYLFLGHCYIDEEMKKESIKSLEEKRK